MISQRIKFFFIFTSIFYFSVNYTRQKFYLTDLNTVEHFFKNCTRQNNTVIHVSNRARRPAGDENTVRKMDSGFFHL